MRTILRVMVTTENMAKMAAIKESMTATMIKVERLDISALIEEFRSAISPVRAVDVEDSSLEMLLDVSDSSFVTVLSKVSILNPNFSTLSTSTSRVPT